MRRGVFHLKQADPTLRQIIEAVGPYRIQYREPDFETLVRSIVYQQLNGTAAGTIFGRLQAAACRDGRPLTPRAILRLAPERLRALGLSGQKAAYVRDLAERTASREVDFARLPALSDEGVIEHLTQVKGVGVWTAHMFLIFALRRPDVLPTGDLGVRAAIKKAWRLEALPTPAEMEALARPWRPWCSVASWYLWRSLEGVAAL
ncbi:MAG: DNA-3-methyladenine glycosylase [Bryobacteraceae bacterium]|nr:DNA-3-methyladenine glycosylase [Bryobacteraceae bacterium]